VSLVERLRKDAEQMRATGLVRDGQIPLAEEAASRIAELEAALKPFAESLVAQTDVKHHSQDWREETDNTVVSISTSHQRKGMPYLSPDHTLWVGAFRTAARALKAEAKG